MKKLFAALFTAMVMTLGIAVTGAPATAVTYPPAPIVPDVSGGSIAIELPVGAKGAITVVFKKKKKLVEVVIPVDGGPEAVKIPKKKLKKKFKGIAGKKAKAIITFTPATGTSYGTATSTIKVPFRK